MRKIDLLLQEYGHSHQNPINKTIHWICVPLIFFSIVGLLWSIPSPWSNESNAGTPGNFVNWATIGLALALVYYITLSVSLFFGMLLFALIMSGVCHVIDNWSAIPLWTICLIIFIAAWIGQFYGHGIEGKKPSFLKDIQFLLIGPAWLMSFIFRKIGVKY